MKAYENSEERQQGEGGTYNDVLEFLKTQEDIMAEWLRRWTANPLGSARAGSNPVVVVFIPL